MYARSSHAGSLFTSIGAMNAPQTLTLMVLGDLKMPETQKKKFSKCCADSTQPNGY